MADSTTDGIHQRSVAEIEGDFVVFRVGMHIHHLWKAHKWVPIFRNMTKIINELEAEDSGLLGWEGKLGIWDHEIIQYWRSAEALEKYAVDPDGEHYSAWTQFINDLDDTVGVWHETYLVKANQYETAYRNMPPYGLAKAATRRNQPEREQSGLERIGTEISQE